MFCAKKEALQYRTTREASNNFWSWTWKFLQELIHRSYQRSDQAVAPIVSPVDYISSSVLYSLLNYLDVFPYLFSSSDVRCQAVREIS